jgi:hypothetical protein
LEVIASKGLDGTLNNAILAELFQLVKCMWSNSSPLNSQSGRFGEEKSLAPPQFEPLIF